MPIFGRYEVVQPIHTGPVATVSRAKLVDKRPADFSVKVFIPVAGAEADRRAAVDAFLERARAQQKVGAAPGGHWAPIRQFGRVTDGAFYVTDYYAGSAQHLIEQQTPLSAASLSHLVKSVVAALRELASSGQPAHGNLKPSNVLISEERLTTARVVLTDPATASNAAKTGEGGDLHALGELIHLLVAHEPPSADPAQPLARSPEWKRLGRTGAAWQQLCADLLTPHPGQPSGHLDELTTIVEGISVRPRRRLPGWLTQAAVAILVLGTALWALTFLAQRDLCRIRADWLDALAASLAEPTRLKHFRQEPALSAVVDDTVAATESSAPCDAQIKNLRPWQFLQIRRRLAAARSVADDLSPSRWNVAARALSVQQQCQSLGWTQPAAFLRDRLAALKPAAGAHPAAAVDDLLALDPVLATQFPQLQGQWKELDVRARQLQAVTDAYVSAFGTFLRHSAAEAIRLTPKGFEGQQTMATNLALAARIDQILRDGFPGNLDGNRFSAEVAAKIDLAHLQTTDIQRWLEKVPLYVLQPAAAERALVELHHSLQSTLEQVNQASPDAEDRSAVTEQHQAIDRDLARFSETRFIAKDIADGAFVAQRVKIESEIGALLEHIHRSDPRGWLRALPVLQTHSDVINAYWEDWKHVLQTSMGEMEQRNDLFGTFKRQTQGLRAALASLDGEFPQAPDNMPAPFAAAAREHREREIGRLLAGIGPGSDQPVVPGKQAAAQAYKQWCANLVALGGQFPLQKEVLTLADQPDEKWASANPDFWNDPTVQKLVRPDTERLRRLRALAKLSRSDLIDSAAESTTPELAFAAWQLLGDPNLTPPWPTASNELDTERDLRVKLAGLAGKLKSDSSRGVVEAALAEQAPVRWRRFVDAAKSEAALQRGLELQPAFGKLAELLAGLSPAARFNLSLYIGRQESQSGDPRATAEIIAALRRAARGLSDAAPVQRLLARLARIEVKEKFSDRNLGETFTVDVAGATTPLVFHRVEPSDDRPFYLCTTAVSCGQFAGIVQAADAWDVMSGFNWAYQPGQRDTRRGPRTWEWTRKPALAMTPPLLWLFPDDDNDYAPSFRIDRFNRTALAEEVGGNPSPEHPMQQLPAEAALYFASLCGCRLPTAAEWRSAYAIFERTVAQERWNLRDRTWYQQQQYAAANFAPATQWPDEGIFRPEQITIPSGRDAKARPQNDGTLFFRKVDGPGGGTFHEMIGNVQQLLCEASDTFDDWPDKGTVTGIRNFVAKTPNSLFVIGGSALSPPDLPLQTPIPLPRADVGYADVGLRLAFTAPARSLAERLKWALTGQRYLWETPAPATAPAH